MSAIQAAKEFKDLMDLSEKENLGSSYTFSDTERVIFVTGVCYAIDVKFKKISKRMSPCFKIRSVATTSLKCATITRTKRLVRW